MAENFTGAVSKAVLDNPFIQCARRDFEAAKKLYTLEPGSQHVDTCNTLFHLEQSVEKLNKFLFITLLSPMGKITNDEEFDPDKLVKKLKGRISHNQAKLFFELNKLAEIGLHNMGVTNYSNLSSSMLSEFGINISTDISTDPYEKVADNLNSIAYLSVKKLKMHLDNADSMATKLSSKKTSGAINTVSAIESSVNPENAQYLQKDSAEKAARFGTDSQQLLDDSVTILWPLLVEAFPKLVTYGIILCPHEDSTRYPGSIIPPAQYDNQEVPISNRYIIRRIISGLEGIFNWIDKLS